MRVEHYRDYRPVTEKETGTEILMRLLEQFFICMCFQKSMQNLTFYFPFNKQPKNIKTIGAHTETAYLIL